jgi:hypothetical protein
MDPNAGRADHRCQSWPRLRICASITASAAELQRLAKSSSGMDVADSESVRKAALQLDEANVDVVISGAPRSLPPGRSCQLSRLYEWHHPLPSRYLLAWIRPNAASSHSIEASIPGRPCCRSANGRIIVHDLMRAPVSLFFHWSHRPGYRQ